MRLDIQKKKMAAILGVLFVFGAFQVGCSKPLKLKAVKATPARVEATITTISSGTVDARNSAELAFGTSGRVASVKVKTGDHVKKGEMLASLENRDLQSVAAEAERELKRSEKLFEEGLISVAAKDETRKAYDMAQASLDKTLMRAPFAGVVTEMNLNVGELSQSLTATAAAKTAMRLIDLEPRYVKGEIDEVDLKKVKVGTQARIKISSARAEPFEATISRVVPFVSTTKDQDRTSKIELDVKGQENVLLPVGASADVEIIVDKKDNVLALPARLVLGTTAQRNVFVYSDGKIHRVDVKVGLGNYDRLEITEGVKEGDVVVYPSDNQDLKEGMKAEIEVTAWP